MARDLSNLEQSFELKANQQQILQDSQGEPRRDETPINEVIRAESAHDVTACGAADSGLAEAPANASVVRTRPRLPREWIYDEDW
jgi:hypothetical protein